MLSLAYNIIGDVWNRMFRNVKFSLIELILTLYICKKQKPLKLYGSEESLNQALIKFGDKGVIELKNGAKVKRVYKN